MLRNVHDGESWVVFVGNIGRSSFEGRINFGQKDRIRVKILNEMIEMSQLCSAKNYIIIIISRRDDTCAHYDRFFMRYLSFLKKYQRDTLILF